MSQIWNVNKNYKYFKLNDNEKNTGHTSKTDKTHT